MSSVSEVENLNDKILLQSKLDSKVEILIFLFLADQEIPETRFIQKRNIDYAKITTGRHAFESQGSIFHIRP
jgi:hypothetical protein